MELKTITIPILGSSGNPYTVVFGLTQDGILKITCNCRAGIFGTFCKHRLAMLSGDFSAATEPIADLELIKSWIAKSNLIFEVKELLLLQTEIDKLNRKLKPIKIKIGEQMKVGFKI